MNRCPLQFVQTTVLRSPSVTARSPRPAFGTRRGTVSIRRPFFEFSDQVFPNERLEDLICRQLFLYLQKALVLVLKSFQLF